MKRNLVQTGTLFKDVDPLELVWRMRSIFKKGVPCRCEGAYKETHLDQGFILFSDGITEGFLYLILTHKVQLWKFPISKTDQGPGKAMESGAASDPEVPMSVPFLLNTPSDLAPAHEGLQCPLWLPFPTNKPRLF